MGHTCSGSSIRNEPYKTSFWDSALRNWGCCYQAQVNKKACSCWPSRVAPYGVCLAILFEGMYLRWMFSRIDNIIHPVFVVLCLEMILCFQYISPVWNGYSFLSTYEIGNNMKSGNWLLWGYCVSCKSESAFNRCYY